MHSESLFARTYKDLGSPAPQKFKSVHYVKTGQPGEYGGIYVWDSPDSLKAYRESDLAKSIPGAYEITAAPNIEIMDILFQLRGE